MYGDSAIDFENPFPIGIAHIIGNSASRYFGITSYDNSGETIDLLVNTTDPYEGTVVLKSDTVLFEINAVGP